ncbi:MAG: phenylalanine--tRNA ligase subunit alpha [Candidatus Levybacteria bacterium CG_4_10_14_0_2_um_filter_36_16]|nr:MAG: phenylalanine--tRNA ligase subunit alpha [Candidatus Levybacteria bacterium CG2_30_37_29]PIR79173.1 MAG: phenylalanine--tRNA ligase subunit alpha [Candidatus Levybacteria bacterium CG10_big_fil_rev_8_21_14_0_10_36_30]PIZ97740.1 MAG: phenylalanine--tRNA ligase subunit alpha [Candidatus Levybacteria bacterium CG_4_10_14_0_2_um_filter_36_16]PJA90705.1 MAG: phenylalanine--tRNA ligase subunit alpha [Candidatus Levybacteria bacterium CG_4_9_14_3_um_filter_36_7]
MEEELINLQTNASSLIISTDDAEELEKIREDFLGKDGSLTDAIKRIGKLPQESRPEIGKLANEIKNTIEDLISHKLKSKKINTGPAKRSKKIDVTMPGQALPLGHLHLITQGIEEITNIFEHIGFTRVRYPEVEWDWYAFTALNFPENHPARDDWETFFVKEEPHPKNGQMVLTPHTSSGQIREMEKGELPIKMLNVAKCYRRQSDVSHVPMFHQFEGLVVGENISITHLKGVLDYFFKSYLGEKRKFRIRPYHFQFTEPSFEIDVSCGVCNGRGCKLCKAGWLELGGAGMVHPNVLKNGGIDTKKYTGFAFGWGVERVLMMKEDLALEDLRILYSNDLRFLEQF